MVVPLTEQYDKEYNLKNNISTYSTTFICKLLHVIHAYTLLFINTRAEQKLPKRYINYFI